MSDAVFELVEGRLPLIVSLPHDGRQVPEDIAARMTGAALELPDTDWQVARLYDFCRELGATMIIARHSRYVVDLNRPPDDAPLYPGQLSTGLCPARTFSGEPIYADGAAVDDAELERRRREYWQPYHDALCKQLSALHTRHGRVLLWDAHSIASRVPSLFEGELPVLNIGTDGGRSCATAVAQAAQKVAAASPYTQVLDGRFTGGYITRHYGAPDTGRHAVQLEIARRGYMDEVALRYDDAAAARLGDTLRSMLESCLEAAAGTERTTAD